nr:TylF/MycF/NovP-related O-methyltransferase [uncultured Butyrivibrio sp.]
MRKIILWGTGGRTEYYLNNGYFGNCEILFFADSDLSKTEYKGIKILHPDEIAERLLSADYLVICSKAYIEILKQCFNLRISWEKIVLTDNNAETLCKEAFERLKDVDGKLYENLSFGKYVITKRNEYDKVDEAIRVGTGKFCGSEYLDEYFRFRTFEFVAKEIRRKNIEGAVAELGVFRGVFSALINDIFPDRQIYLFDTFEGFNDEEARREIENGYCDESFIEAHKISGEDAVMSALPYPKKGVICKGFFPSSIPEKVYEEKFAFVSLDVDFEESTYQGLKFFYPRLSEGGAIFIHDYHTASLEGVEIAVRRYEKDNRFDLKCVPIADRAGTLIVMK